MNEQDFQMEGTPDAVREAALACVQYVQRALGVLLDFTPETLPLLDHYLAGAAGAGDEIRELIAPAAGAYFGQVVRRIHPARWSQVGDDPMHWRLEFETCFLHFRPAELALEAILQRDEVEGGGGFQVNPTELEAVRQAIEVMGAVAVEDYYRLSTRLEVLEALVDRLMGAAVSRGQEDVYLGAEVYRRALGESTARPS